MNPIPISVPSQSFRSIRGTRVVRINDSVYGFFSLCSPPRSRHSDTQIAKLIRSFIESSLIIEQHRVIILISISADGIRDKRWILSIPVRRERKLIPSRKFSQPENSSFNETSRVWRIGACTPSEERFFSEENYFEGMIQPPEAFSLRFVSTTNDVSRVSRFILLQKYCSNMNLWIIYKIIIKKRLPKDNASGTNFVQLVDSTRVSE